MNNIQVVHVDTGGASKATFLLGLINSLTEGKIHKLEDLNNDNIQSAEEVYKKAIENKSPALDMSTIEILVIGASRKLLHTFSPSIKCVEAKRANGFNELSDYVVPYQLLYVEQKRIRDYEAAMELAFQAYGDYEDMPDVSSYLLPRAARTTFLISASVTEWKRFMRNFTCCRKSHSTEARFVALSIWSLLYERDPILFNVPWGELSQSPTEELRLCYPKLVKEPDNII